MSIQQIKDVINGKSVLGTRREILEVKNAWKAYEHIENVNPYSQNDLLESHRIMMESLVDDAGGYRTHEEGVFDGDKVIFLAPPPRLVPELMDKLFDYLENYEENLLIKSCVFHYEFEFIHPFSDGNGRMGRLFQTGILLKDNPIYRYLPIETQIHKSQKDYYDVIALCNSVGNSDAFIEFMLKMILLALQDYSADRNDDNDIHVEKLISQMNAKVEYSSNELMLLVNQKSKPTFYRLYLKPALQGGYVGMTIPSQPKNRNQKYYLK